ncbi:MAG: hypothetical protein H0V02_03035 [Nocardioidaceae bacterium]|nr:hypothetical protein [Nocardioidaceae bacterium]
MSHTVFLHVGVAKTGTTYLQRNLQLNRKRLRKHGVLYPGASNAGHFFASLDLQGRSLRHAPAKIDGAWSRLVEEANAWSGSTIISHETFARTPRETIASAVKSFAASDVRVLLTVRDLERQLSAVWQERLKNQNAQTYDAFLRSVMATAPGVGQDRQSPDPEAFWGVHDIVSLAERWAEVVGPESVLLVTVPPSGTDRQELWRRFSQAVELPAVHLKVDDAVSNKSLGVAETELLRRLNARLPADLTSSVYRRHIKRKFVQGTLVAEPSHGGLSVPRQWHGPIGEVASATIDALAGGGYRVVGNLEDLRPRLSPGTGNMPDELEDGTLLNVALDLLIREILAPQGSRSHHPLAKASRFAARRRRRGLSSTPDPEYDNV